MAREMALAAADVVAECLLTTTTEQAKEEGLGGNTDKNSEDLDTQEFSAKGQDPRSQPKFKKKRKKRSRKTTFKGSKERCRRKNKELTQLMKKFQVENEVLNEKNSTLIKRSLMLQRQVCS